MKYIKHLLVAFCLLIVSLVRADEGMWLPLLLEKNEREAYEKPRHENECQRHL